MLCRNFRRRFVPSLAVKNPKAKGDDSPWLLLVQTHPATVDLDKPVAASDRNWHASPAKKFERLFRETGVPIGLLTNGVQFRLIYAPPKENSGSLTFPVGAMAEVSGRLILGAFQLLLGSWTLFTAPSEARLPGLLQRSREYQASVSEILAEQVLHALYELLRGFEAADERVRGKLLRELAAKNPSEIYGGLVAVLLRFVFTLFAEDRGLLPAQRALRPQLLRHGLFERLRADAERYPDTMDHRFGAWAQLLALFRVIHGGCKHPELKMPARHGHLFDPDRYPFLEGRVLTHANPIGALPLVSDGTIYRILEKLSILEGERVSYRTLGVEEIGSVYQTIMGFAVETATGTAIAMKGKRKNGGVPAAPVIKLEELLARSRQGPRQVAQGKSRHGTHRRSREETQSRRPAIDDLLVALEKRIDRNATPGPVAKGGLVLQPTDERRRSGSHYTPRSFTEPIVRKTLEPILKRLGANPDTRANPGTQDLRPRRRLRRFPRRNLPPAWPRNWSKPGACTAAARRSRPMRPRNSSPCAPSRNTASTAWTATRWPWTSPSSPSGSPPWPRIIPSPSSTTPSAAAIPSWASPATSFASGEYLQEQRADLGGYTMQGGGCTNRRQVHRSREHVP